MIQDRRILRRLVPALLGTAVALSMIGLAELGLRLAGIPDPGLYEGDPAGLWFLRPGLDREVPHPAGPFHVETNALGLRGPLPPEEEHWTLVLGCSTTFGWGVEQEEAFPARMEALLGERMVNGGVPGWSTEQAVQGARRWLDLGPSRVILAYIVRDAWPASVPDHLREGTPFLLRTQLGRLIRGLRKTPSPGPESLPAEPATNARVPPERFVENLRRLQEMATGAEVVLLAFPQPDPRPLRPWVEAMRRVGEPLEPALPPDAFFEEDPVHLDPEGHAALAEWVAARL